MQQLSLDLGDQASTERVRLPRTTMKVERDKYKLFYRVTVTYGDRTAVTTLPHYPSADDPVIIKLRKGFLH